jgi:hypothetical protein
MHEAGAATYSTGKNFMIKVIKAKDINEALNKLAESILPRPEHGYTCFHCHETFTDEIEAAGHFGVDENAKPGCILAMPRGEERGLLLALRATEQQAIALMNQVHEQTAPSRRLQALVTASIRSFTPFRECDTLQDVFNVYDSMEGRALAAEKTLREYETERARRHVQLAASEIERELTRLRLLEINIRNMLTDMGDDAVRVREGGAEEDLAMSLAVTMVKLQKAGRSTQ